MDQFFESPNRPRGVRMSPAERSRLDRERYPTRTQADSKRHYRRYVDEIILRQEYQRRGKRVLLAGRVKPECCEICGRRPGKKGLVFEHDHKCCDTRRTHLTCGNCFRGWVCQRCNVVIAYVDENPLILEAVASYLRAWKRTQNVGS
jgi:hypothetical protein